MLNLKYLKINMKHHEVNHNTELKIGDFIIINNCWAEIYRITEDHGIFTSMGNICRSKIKNYSLEFEI